MTLTQAKKKYKTHFDMIHEEVEGLRVEIKDNFKEMQNLFESSNAQTDEHKKFILENDQERVVNIQWAKAAFDKYEQMMADFKQFKVDTNALFGNLAKDYKDDVVTMKARVDEIKHRQDSVVQNAELMKVNFEDFERRREDIE